MKKLVLALTAFGLTMATNAQDLPQPSPTATLSQRVGLTDFTIEYSRPSSKDREIFGALVPFDKLWRTGANKATKVSFNAPVMFGKKLVPAGDYSLFTIPSQAMWTIILNKETELWGTGDYNADMNVVSLEVKPMKAPSVESFTIDINELRNESALITLHWQNTLVAIPIKVQTNEKAMANIKMAISDAKDDDKWKVYRNAANYYNNNGIQPEMALEYINQSVALNKDSWYSFYLQSEILASLNKYAEASKAAALSLNVGQKEAEENDKDFSYTEMLTEAIKNYEAKIN
jgi:tetratricopeptide (TPR) repeat protein